MRTFGLIPAAGKSRRMGQPKLVLPLGGTTVIEQVLSAVHGAGVADVLVVVAPDDESLALLAAGAGANVLRLDADTPDMRATCLHGVSWISEHLHPSSDDGWLLLPADHPTVRPDIIRAIVAAADSITDKSIIIPTHNGRRGHPTWLRWCHVAPVQQIPQGQGLNTYLRSQTAQILELPWPNDEILIDLDTPEDYVRLLRR